MEWWKYGNIVEQQSRITRSKTESLLDQLSRRAAQRREEEERKALAERGWHAQLNAAFNVSKLRARAADEIDEANQALSKLGVQWSNLIPVSESTIKSQIISGRTWASNIVTDAEQSMQLAQQEAETKLRSNIVGGLFKKGLISYDTDPDVIERLTEQKLAEYYAEEAFKRGDYDLAKQWRDRALELAEPPEEVKPEKWPGYIEMWRREKEAEQPPTAPPVGQMPAFGTLGGLQPPMEAKAVEAPPISDEQKAFLEGVVEQIPTYTIKPGDIGLPISGYDWKGEWFARPDVDLTFGIDFNIGTDIYVYHEDKKIGLIDIETGDIKFDDSDYVLRAMAPSYWDRQRLKSEGKYPAELPLKIIGAIDRWLKTPIQMDVTPQVAGKVTPPAPGTEEEKVTVAYPSPGTILGMIGLAGTLIYTGVQGVQTLNLFLNTSQTVGRAYIHLRGVTVSDKPKPPPSVAGTVAEIKMYKEYQQTAIYRDWQTLVNQAKISPTSIRYKNIDGELFRAFQLFKYDNAPQTAQRILDQIRIAAAIPGATLQKRAVVPYTGAGVTPPTPTPTTPTPTAIPPTGGMPPTVAPSPVGVTAPAVTGQLFTAIVYRGTKAGVAPIDEGLAGKAEYWTTDTEYAATYGEVKGATVKLNNPLVINTQSEWDTFAMRTRELRDRALAEGKSEDWVQATLRTQLGKEGYDGVVITEGIVERGTQVAVFHPEKSVTPEAVKPTAIAEEITAVTPETRAMAEAETITGEIPEGEIIVEGLEPVRNIRRIETRFRQKQATYDQTKKQLSDYVKELPLAVRGKMLAAVKNVKTDLDLTRAIALTDRYAEEYAQKTLKTKITSELRKIRPTKVAGMRYGKFTPATQKQLNLIKANLQLDRENVKAEILKSIEAAEEGKISFEQADEANEILQVSGLKGMSSDELAYTLRQVKSLKETGRGLRAAEREAELERVTEKREAVITSLTGGKGIKPGVGTIDTKDMWARESKPKSFLTNWQFGMDDILDKLSRLDKTSKPFQSPLSRLGFNLHMSRSTQQMGVIAWVDKKTASKISEIYGVKGRSELNRFLGRLTHEKINLGTFKTTEGQQVTLKLTKDQIIQKYLELQDPTLDETFRMEMKWTDEIMNVVKDSMTVEDLRYADWLSVTYVGDYGKTIKPVFEAKYHIPFPENPHYVPIGRDLEGSYYEHILTVQDNYRYASVTNPSLKARTKSRIPLKFNGATQVWVRHVVQMEHFKAFASSMKEARMVFGNKDVRTAIRQYHGNDVLKHLDRHLDDIARDGIDRALIVGGIDKLRGHFTLAALGVKVSVSAKQALSLPAYLTYEPMPIKDFFTGVADFYKHPLANIREMKELSGYFSERWGRGHERDVRLVKEKDVAGRLSNSKNWRDLLMLGIHKVDTAVTQPGSWAVYQSMKKQGISRQEAITHAEVATKRSQPSFGLEDMAALRKHGSFGKLFTMFQSQPNKYYRLIADSARNLKAGRGSKGRNTLNILLAWWVLPMMFQLVSDAFQWKKEHQMRVAILGPANYLLTAGQILQSAYGWITDEPFPAEASPVFSTLRELQYAITGTVNLLEQGKDPLKDVDTDYLISTIEHYAKAIGQLVGLPTPYAVQAERAIRNADIRQMVFSDYALRSPDEALTKLQDIYAREVYGKDKWRELTNEQQDRFWELRPDLK